MDTIEPMPIDPLARLIAPSLAPVQPPLVAPATTVMHAAIGSLAIGGAERIVLDWAGIAARNYRVRILVLRSASPEWRVPDGVEIIRLAPGDAQAQLAREAATMRASGNPQVLCHLLSAAARNALRSGGAIPIPVVHNAALGWIEPAAALAQAPLVIAVCAAAASELKAAGIDKVSVVRHLPRPPVARPGARAALRARWQIPQSAFVVGMIGAIKPQKAYPRALKVLAELLARRDAWLVILGGPIGKDGLIAWDALLAQAHRLGVVDRLRVPGFVPDAARALPAFDCVLNTSRYEGLSIATLEALAVGLPVVATAVGGQGEAGSPGLTLLAADCAPARFAIAIEDAARAPPSPPRWAGFPAARLWTAMHLPMPARPAGGTLFVTANLNAGGAQRSLVNLALALASRLTFEIIVCDRSSSDAFTTALQAAGICIHRGADSRDCFDHAEAILDRIGAREVRTIVFWNVDPKVKLLIAKRLACSTQRLIDVSPGGYAFEEMAAVDEFQSWIAYCAREYYARLDRLVLKYKCNAPVAARTAIIPNGVPLIEPRPRTRDRPLRRVVVSGRIAPSKFLLEIAAAMHAVWQRVDDAELHILGTGEIKHREYAAAVVTALASEIDRRAYLHGAAFDAPRRLDQFDIAVVIGHHQGSPNAVLEAMAAGLAVVANDSGGTGEAVIDRRTGILLADRAPATIAAALVHLMQDTAVAVRYARQGRAHIARRFSMHAMANAYYRLFTA